MRKLIRILTVQSVLELFKYKSFLLLVFGLVVADRILKRWVHVDRSALQLPPLRQWSQQTAAYVFDRLPDILVRWIGDYRIFLVLTGLFLLKEIISLWPSSDMRRMHRREREAFGLIGALRSLRWSQVAWDVIAVITVCGFAGLWSILIFTITRIGWNASANPFWFIALALLLFPGAPVVMAGFSYSSKLAVISRGGFFPKLILFLKLFTSWTIFWKSWVFFLARVMVESVFVVAIPGAVLLLVRPFGLRILLASLLATPVYSFLKMASFKFFLEIYHPFPLVREEYETYFQERAAN